MANAIKDTGLRDAGVTKDSGKLTATQQKAWSNSIMSKMIEGLKAKSVNQVVWGNPVKKK